MNALSAWFDGVRVGWKALGAIIAIFGAGLTTGAAAGGFTGLPKRVSSVEVQVQSLRQDVTAIRKANQQMLCLTIAEREHSDWRRCLEEPNAH